jgi:UDP-glucose 4-epimerase
MRERCLVTGAAGFIGSSLCRRLVSEGNAVIGFDDLSEGTTENLSDVPEVTLIEKSLCDGGAVAAAARGCTTIFHQAAKRSVPRSIEEPRLFAEVNVLGTLNVLLAAGSEDAKVIQASSSSVYGDQVDFPLRESMEPRPRSPYAASKLAAEIYGAAMWRSARVPSIALRYFNVYGPGQSPDSEYAAVVPRFISACLSGESPTIYGDGTQSRDFTYIDDVVDANLLAARAQEGAYGRAFNIGGGVPPTSVAQLLAMVGRACGVTPKPTFEASRQGDVKTTQADVSAAHEAFGYEPAVDIETGLGRTAAWFAGSP